MKKTIFFLVGILMISSTGFSAPQRSLEGSLDSIENQYNELLRREEAQKESYRQQKEQMEAELVNLRAQLESREKLVEKLRVDAEVRWHRDKYRTILRNAETQQKDLIKNIALREQKIAELETLLSVMN